MPATIPLEVLRGLEQLAAASTGDVPALVADARLATATAIAIADDAGLAHALEAAGERILLRDAFGAERLLWGSDWPHTQFERTASYGAVRAQFDQWITRPAERVTILQKTPAELFRFQPAAQRD